MNRTKTFAQYIAEKRNQLEIPFVKGQDPFHGKPLHVHFIDAIEDLGKKVKGSFRSSRGWEHAVTSAIPAAAEELCGEDSQQLQRMHLMSFYNSLDEKEIKRFIVKDCQDGNIDFSDEWDALTDRGKAEIKKRMKSILDNVLSEDSYLLGSLSDSVTNGLIPVWRAITLDSKKIAGVDNDRHGVDDEDYADLYELMTKKFKGVGQYWSFLENKAEAYWGSGDTEVLMHGMVRTEDVDWVTTVICNTGDLYEECEINVRDNGSIKLTGVTFNDGKHEGYHEFKPALTVHP